MKIVTAVPETKNILFMSSDSKCLELIACGYYDLRNTDATFTCKRNSGICKNYMLQILLSGQGYHIIDGETVHLQPGQCILYSPNQSQHITHYGIDNPSYLWLHFSGENAHQIVNDLDLEGIHTLSNLPTIKKMILQLVNEKRSLIPNNHYLCQGLLLQFLVTLSRYFKENSSLTIYAGKITPAIEHMTYHYAARGLSNQDYAKMCYLSESRFSHVFKEVTGTTPNKFIEQKRIDAAKELLVSTNSSVSDIALLVGYEDAYYFSRVFKKNVGISPQHYVKQIQKSGN